MKEINDELYLINSIQDVLINDVNDKINSLDNINDYKEYYIDHEELSSELYDICDVIIHEKYNLFLSEAIEKKFIFRRISNNNSNNLGSSYFTILKHQRIANLYLSINYNTEEDKFIVTPRRESDFVFTIHYNKVEFSDKTKSYEIKGGPRGSNNIQLRDIGYFEASQKGIIKLSHIKSKIEGIDLLLKNKIDEINKIKNDKSSLTYVFDFMKTNKIENELLSNIKTKMILDTIENSSEDETIDSETNINEIINLEI